MNIQAKVSKDKKIGKENTAVHSCLFERSFPGESVQNEQEKCIGTAIPFSMTLVLRVRSGCDVFQRASVHLPIKQSRLLCFDLAVWSGGQQPTRETDGHQLEQDRTVSWSSPSPGSRAGQHVSGVGWMEYTVYGQLLCKSTSANMTPLGDFHIIIDKSAL